jgi:hypothetical protein
VKKTLTKEADGVSRVEFSGVAELMAYANDGERNLNVAENIEPLRHWREYEGDRWVNYATRKKLTEWMTSAPSHLLERVERFKERIQDKVALPTKQRRKRIRRQETGDELDPVAWVQRDPNGWDDTKKISVPRNSIKIGFNYSTPGSMPAEALLVRGAIVAALADLLSQQGNNVEVVGFDTGYGLGDCASFVMTTVIKPMEAPLDLSSLCVAAAEIGFYRVVVVPASIVFASAKCHSGPCACGPLPSAEKKSMDIVVEWRQTSEDAAVEYVLEQLARFGTHHNTEVESDELF